MSGRTWQDSPAADALALAVESMFPGSVARRHPEEHSNEIVVSSYSEDFSELWRLNANEKATLFEWVAGDATRPRTLVVVCDGSPEALGKLPLDMRRYISPYDWALAFSLSIFEEIVLRSNASDQEVNQLYPSVRILMLDLCSSKDYTDAFGYQALTAIGQAFPWIQVYRSLRAAGGEVESALIAADASLPYFRTVVPAGSFGVETFYSDLLSTSRIMSLRVAQEERDRRPILKALKDLWRNSLIKPSDRHQIGNLIGPMVLIDALPNYLRTQALSNWSLDAPRDVLRKILELMGLSHHRGKSSAAIPNEGLLRSLQADGDIFGRRDEIRFLLVDDQFSVGYQHALGYALFGDVYDPSRSETTPKSSHFRCPAGELLCEETAESVMVALENASTIGDWSLPRVFDLCDILLLDLRLWSTAGARRDFLTRLIGICDHLEAKKITDSKLRLALRQARRISEERKDTTGDNDSEIETLALLPLLLSHYDPSLPIVLFSSTHQRAILDAVSHRPNIVTDFAKPIFSGYGDELDLAKLGFTLKTVITKAVKLHESRSLWNTISRTDWNQLPVFELADRRDGNVMHVFNAVGNTFPQRGDGKLRTAAGKRKPRLRGSKLRIRLAEHYVEYFERFRSYDFTSIPWEILEGNLVPEEFLNDPAASDPKFSLDPRLSAQNHLAELVRYIRNKKAHGYARPPTNEVEAEEYRLASVLTFMFFTDFLNNQYSDAASPSKVDEMASYLKMRYRSLRKLGNVFKPKVLVDDLNVGWLEFVAYAACYCAEEATSLDKTKRFVSAETFDAVGRLRETLLRRHWLENRKSLPKGIRKGDLFKARVVSKTSNCFQLETQQPRFFASLPYEDSCPHTRIGDLLKVAVSDCSKDEIEMCEDQANSLRLYVRLGNRRQPDEVSNWFLPPPKQVRVRTSGSGLYYAYADFASHLDTHRALKQLPLATRRIVEFAD